MFNGAKRRAKTRAILTDTLPYEVPVIFSNDRRYAAIVAEDKPEHTRRNEIVRRIVGCSDTTTKPYSYSIVKDGKRFTTLGIIHPGTQLRIAAFYDTFSQAMLAVCQNSGFSLRRPLAETPLFSEAELSGETTFRLGIPHTDPDEGDIDLSHLSSFFSYSKYNLLGKFIESEEFRRLEKRFRFMKSLDVSKCFFNIYTHSVSWAIKGKDIAKATKSAFSFESELDSLMQAANYGETNGIIVGPEFSRIFAEIIFQDIDRKVEHALLPKFNNRDYAIRRYVDDFFIFANSEDETETIERIISDVLEKYKLFLNSGKSTVSSRPFISPISLARTDIGSIINDIYNIADDIANAPDPSAMASKARALKTRASDIRQACARQGVAIHVVSGWLLANLRNVLAKLVRHGSSRSQEYSSALYKVISTVLDVIFYICAVDLRVRSTYSLCQCLSIIPLIMSYAAGDIADRIMHLISEELPILIRNALAPGMDQSGGVEIANLLITGRHYLGPDFLRNDVAKYALKRMVSDPGLSYFRYIAAKFCMLNDARYETQLAELNRKAMQFIGDGLSRIKLEAEAYLIFCDILSAPDISIREKAKIFKDRFGGNPSNDLLKSVFDTIGFVDWTGVAIQHTLERKALRPVYTWS
ncbi:antiviral reverse transcriptase Drt3b [Acetobacter nitrogenifigens]|uniref:antiviral reverse transcriptase Drt3b n=1 Tax=Acetobacter nitrogenifigens TaxID=285268 RepID=UPI000419665B|nr:antiviral reverse transcriptase Drt3b [Acetobacter nitrogenifigens]